ncbi:Uma2 family endonuclease [Nocardia amamiensis]|uniref:Uma2 family endonuclease n=1 Tax=Nocardia amamiensis TaxID=404578 RepID=UPI000A9C0A7E|nr:Uma2 family endonuclease [Nocardia amamiensis]
MTTLELPDVFEWTPRALERLSPEFRYEVREGNLVVMAAAMRPWHANAQARVWRLLTAADRLAYIEQGIVLGDSEIRTCDVGVYRQSPQGDHGYRPATEFELLVEVVSPGSVREDRETKPKLYAAAGVPEYWRVEESADGAPVVYQYRLTPLADGAAVYAETRVVLLEALEAGDL